MRQEEKIEFLKKRIIILHLWADYCKICREELPTTLKILLNTQHAKNSNVQLLIVNENPNSYAMEAYLDKNQDHLPSVTFYQDTNENLSHFLRQFLRVEDLPLPLTLVVNQNKLICRLIIGALQGRESAVMDFVKRLLPAAKKD